MSFLKFRLTLVRGLYKVCPDLRGFIVEETEWVVGRSFNYMGGCLMIVFPFFIGIPIGPGNYTITAQYQPSPLKLILLLGSLTALVISAGKKHLFKVIQAKKGSS